MVPQSSGLTCVQRGIGSAVGKDARKDMGRSEEIELNWDDRKMDARHVSETSVSAHKTTPCHNPEDPSLNSQRREEIKA
jgi:hypothetical protein